MLLELECLYGTFTRNGKDFWKLPSSIFLSPPSHITSFFLCVVACSTEAGERKEFIYSIHMNAFCMVGTLFCVTLRQWPKAKSLFSWIHLKSSEIFPANTWEKRHKGLNSFPDSRETGSRWQMNEQELSETELDLWWWEEEKQSPLIIAEFLSSLKQTLKKVLGCLNWTW